jgi:hypothetical protein
MACYVNAGQQQLPVIAKSAGNHNNYVRNYVQTGAVIPGWLCLALRLCNAVTARMMSWFYCMGRTGAFALLIAHSCLWAHDLSL